MYEYKDEANPYTQDIYEFNTMETVEVRLGIQEPTLVHRRKHRKRGSEAKKYTSTHNTEENGAKPEGPRRMRIQK